MLNKHALWYTSFAAQCQARKQAAYLTKKQYQGLRNDVANLLDLIFVAKKADFLRLICFHCRFAAFFVL